VPLEDLDSVSLILEAPVEGALPDYLVRHAAPASGETAEDEEADRTEDQARDRGLFDEHAQLVDGAAGALVPPFRVSHAQEHLGFGMLLHELLVERAGRPVHGGLVAPEDPFPIRRLFAPGGDPEVRVLRVREDLGHVVARTEAEFLQRRLQRRRARPAEAGTDDLHLILG
jgi:hypothetical protein